MPDKAAPGALLVAWVQVFWVAMCAPIIPKLFQSAFVYSQPFLIKAAIGLATQPVEPFYQNVGYGLIGAYTIVFAGEAVSQLLLLLNMSELGTQVDITLAP